MPKGKDILFIFYVTVIPLAILAVFPYSAIGFVPSRDARAESAGTCSFVRLTQEQEYAAIESSRTAWRSPESSVSELMINLYSIEIPEMEASKVSRVEERTDLPISVAEPYLPLAMPLSLSAPEARLIEQKSNVGIQKTKPFSRNDLLKMIQIKKEIQL
jgi:hypothetical protein